MPHCVGWMRACSRLTVPAHPIAAVPAGFTDDGLPVGLQLVGRHRGDRRLLDHAAAWEAATGLTDPPPRAALSPAYQAHRASQDHTTAREIVFFDKPSRDATPSASSSAA